MLKMIDTICHLVGFTCSVIGATASFLNGNGDTGMALIGGAIWCLNSWARRGQ